MTRILPLALLILGFTASQAQAFDVGSGKLDWQMTNVYNLQTPAPNDRTFLGYFVRGATPGNPNGLVATEAPATGGPVDRTSPAAGAQYTFSFPAKATGSYDPATKTGSLQFDGKLLITSPNGTFLGGPQSKGTLDDPEILFDGDNTARLVAEGRNSDDAPYGRDTTLFELTLPEPAVNGDTVTFDDVYPRVPTAPGPLVTFGFDSSVPDRTPATWGLMDITVTAEQAAGPKVTVTPATDVESGQDVTVAGSGFASPTGIYVLFGPNDAPPTPPAPFSAQPSFAFVTPAQLAGGAFSVQIPVTNVFTNNAGAAYDCVLTKCGIRTIAAHFGPDRTQDTITPITFKQADAVPTPTATPTTTPTATPDYSIPKPKKARVTKIRLKRKKLTFGLSRRATVTGTIKRRGETVRRIAKGGRKGANTVRFKRKLEPGRYKVRLKPRGGAARTKVVRLKVKR